MSTDIIYRLIDKRDNSTFYVGITDDVYARFMQHIQCSGNNYAKNARIHEMRQANVMVVMETLESIENNHSYASEREAYWIQHYQLLGEPLTNISKTVHIHTAKKTNIELGKMAREAMLSRLTSMEKIVKPSRGGINISPDEEAQILSAAAQLGNQGKVTRTGIRDRLEWNNKQYPKIQYVCDKFKIAM